MPEVGQIDGDEGEEIGGVEGFRKVGDAPGPWRKSRHVRAAPEGRD